MYSAKKKQAYQKKWQSKNKAKVKTYNLRKRQEHQKYWAVHNPYEETQFKRCGKCDKKLLSTDFYRDNSAKDGLNGHCKNCAYLKNELGAVNRMLSKAKVRAKAKGLEFSLKQEDIRVPKVCPVLGIPIFYGKGRNSRSNPNSPSLDRKD